MKTATQILNAMATASLACLLWAKSDEDPVRFKVDSALIRLDVQVEEGDLLISGLRREDFVVYEDSRQQSILYFTNASAPVDVVLLMDVSASMDPLALALAKTAKSALSVLQPDDRVSLLSFTTKAKTLIPFTVDHSDILVPIRRIASSHLTGDTNLYRALEDACRYIQLTRRTTRVAPEDEHRRVILMLTDGVAGRADREERTLRALWEANTTVDAMIVGPSQQQLMRIERARSLGLLTYKLQDLRRIADQTGGTVISSTRVDIDLPRILERSRTRYTLFYRPHDDGKAGFRQVRVDLTTEARGKHSAARLRTRKGYFHD